MTVVGSGILGGIIGLLFGALLGFGLWVGVYAILAVSELAGVISPQQSLLLVPYSPLIIPTTAGIGTIIGVKLGIRRSRRRQQSSPTPPYGSRSNPA